MFFCQEVRAVVWLIETEVIHHVVFLVRPEEALTFVQSIIEMIFVM